VQQRFEETATEINDLRDQIEAMKTEKNLLEKRIQIEAEVRKKFVILNLYIKILFKVRIQK
jgi:hypothetical protein